MGSRVNLAAPVSPSLGRGGARLLQRELGSSQLYKFGESDPFQQITLSGLMGRLVLFFNS